jgi:glycosyltransferase involved in cell wall biosynthesis
VAEPPAASTVKPRSSSASRTLLWINAHAVVPSSGGGTRHFELGRELAGRGWRVRIGASDFHLHGRSYAHRKSALHRRPVLEQVDGVEFCWYWAAPYRANDWRRAVNWLTFGHAVARDRDPRFRPDVIIGSSPHLVAALAAERVARRLGVPFIFEIRDLWPESMLAVGYRPGLGYRALDRIAHHLYERATKVIVLARGSADYLRSRRGVPAHKLVYIPNGVDVERVAPGRRSERNGFTAVYAGAHGPANGLETVLDAAEHLRAQTGIRILLVGDGPSKAELMGDARRRGLNNVEFRNPVPKNRIGELLAEADAGLMVLRPAEIFSYGVSPNKLFDYFGAGLPVVCNVPGEVAGMVERAGGGVQVPVDSADGLAAGILSLAALAPEDRERMGSAAREWVGIEHGRARLGAELDAALCDCVEG